MMNHEVFYNQSWFWAGFFTTIASIGGILIKELIDHKSKVKIERLKIYESNLFKAYNDLHHFVSIAYDLCLPPGDFRQTFCALMGQTYLKGIEPQFLFYNSDIRKILSTFESQYRCIGNPDLNTEKSLDEFFDKDFFMLLGQLEENIQEKIDQILDNKKE